jgi:hypothetical protein
MRGTQPYTLLENACVRRGRFDGLGHEILIRPNHNGDIAAARILRSRQHMRDEGAPHNRVQCLRQA